jgi:CheY-like chemotaxis protein
MTFSFASFGLRSPLMHVIIIDDDLEDSELFREAVNEINSSIKISHVQDGKEALQHLQQLLPVVPDFIFLDINMPVMNGRETLIQIKKIPRVKDIRVVMYSTTSDTAEIKTYYQLGAYDFLIKPHNFKKLVEALESILTMNNNGR